MDSNITLYILTPVRVDVDLNHLKKAWQSVREIKANWQWVVQVNGESDILVQKIKEMGAGYPVTVNQYDRSYGAAVARNTALALSD